jgi:hypothetical protein
MCARAALAPSRNSFTTNQIGEIVDDVHRLRYRISVRARAAYGSDEPRLYRAGETLQDRADIPHTLFRNCDSERPLRFLTIYVLEPGRSYTMEP